MVERHISTHLLLVFNLLFRTPEMVARAVGRTQESFISLPEPGAHDGANGLVQMPFTTLPRAVATNRMPLVQSCRGGAAMVGMLTEALWPGQAEGSSMWAASRAAQVVYV